MPSKEERLFFQRSFRLIDRERRTHWYDIYNFSLSQSQDGRIDWGLLPGLISQHYNGFGYVKALNRVTEILLEIVESDPNDRRLQKKLRPLAFLAKTIYEIRLSEVQANFKGDEGHNVALNAWKDAAEALEEILLVQSPSFVNVVGKALMIIGVALSCYCTAWYLLRRFSDNN